jgi:hypothetical protein
VLDGGSSEVLAEADLDLVEAARRRDRFARSARSTAGWRVQSVTAIAIISGTRIAAAIKIISLADNGNS